MGGWCRRSLVTLDGRGIINSWLGDNILFAYPEADSLSGQAVEVLLIKRVHTFSRHDISYKVAVVAVSGDRRKIIATQNSASFLFNFNGEQKIHGGGGDGGDVFFSFREKFI